MIDKRYKVRWFWIVASALLDLLVGFHWAVAEDADGLRVTDYFISHTSNEPFYAEQNLDPNVTLYVREVVPRTRTHRSPRRQSPAVDPGLQPPGLRDVRH